MQDTSDATALARAAVSADQEAIRSLRELLIAEREALSRREPEELNRVVEQKLQCLTRLQQNEVARKRLMSRHRCSDWIALLERLDPTLAAQWQSLRAELDDVAELSRANERIVARSRHTTERLLTLLRGQRETPGVYDRRGRTRACGDNRAITSA